MYRKGNKAYWVEARRRVAGVLPCQAVKTQARRMLRSDNKTHIKRRKKKIQPKTIMETLIKKLGKLIAWRGEGA